MGTRYVLKIKGFPVKLYGQYDGYPEHVLPLIQPLVDRFTDSRGYEPDLLMAAIVRKFELNSFEFHFQSAHKDWDLAVKHHEQYGNDFLSFRLFTGKDYEGIDYTYTIAKNGKITYKEC